MTDSDLFNTNNEGSKPKSNVPEFSVGELAFSLKKTLEDNYGRVRVRGELSRVSIAGSGHMYSALKDNDAVIDAVCWKGVMNKLSVRPEEGLEVICTGRISSYPKSGKTWVRVLISALLNKNNSIFEFKGLKKIPLFLKVSIIVE
mgnify:CR=1 FL=1